MPARFAAGHSDEVIRFLRQLARTRASCWLARSRRCLATIVSAKRIFSDRFCRRGSGSSAPTASVRMARPSNGVTGWNGASGHSRSVPAITHGLSKLIMRMSQISAMLRNMLAVPTQLKSLPPVPRAVGFAEREIRPGLRIRPSSRCWSPRSCWGWSVTMTRVSVRHI